MCQFMYHFKVVSNKGIWLDRNVCIIVGMCVNVANAFKCHCRGRTKGVRCELSGFCDSTRCQHGADCTDTVTGAVCNCPSGYTG